MARVDSTLYTHCIVNFILFYFDAWISKNLKTRFLHIITFQLFIFLRKTRDINDVKLNVWVVLMF